MYPSSKSHTPIRCAAFNVSTESTSAEYDIGVSVNKIAVATNCTMKIRVNELNNKNNLSDKCLL